MKFINFFSLLAMVACLSLTSCKDNGATATDETRESLASTNTTSEKAPLELKTPGEEIPAGPLTSMEFTETSFDFGDIQDGEKVTHVFEFKNTGTEPLIISNAKGSCGCTVPQWSREPVAPGATGEMTVEYNSKNKGKPEGKPESKRVTVTANTDPAQTFVTIKGKVFKPADAGTPAS